MLLDEPLHFVDSEFSELLFFSVAFIFNTFEDETPIGIVGTIEAESFGFDVCCLASFKVCCARHIKSSRSSQSSN